MNAKNKDGYTALMKATFEDHTDIICALTAAGADVNKTDNHGYTPLMRAALIGHTNAVRALTAAGADINAKNHASEPALQLASNHETRTLLSYANSLDTKYSFEAASEALLQINNLSKEDCACLKERILHRFYHADLKAALANSQPKTRSENITALFEEKSTLLKNLALQHHSSFLSFSGPQNCSNQTNFPSVIAAPEEIFVPKSNSFERSVLRRS